MSDYDPKVVEALASTLWSEGRSKDKNDFHAAKGIYETAIFEMQSTATMLSDSELESAKLYVISLWISLANLAARAKQFKQANTTHKASVTCELTHPSPRLYTEYARFCWDRALKEKNAKKGQERKSQSQGIFIEGLQKCAECEDVDTIWDAFFGLMKEEHETRTGEVLTLEELKESVKDRIEGTDGGTGFDEESSAAVMKREAEDDAAAPPAKKVKRENNGNDITPSSSSEKIEGVQNTLPPPVPAPAPAPTPTKTKKKALHNNPQVNAAMESAQVLLNYNAAQKTYPLLNTTFALCSIADGGGVPELGLQLFGPNLVKLEDVSGGNMLGVDDRRMLLRFVCADVRVLTVVSGLRMMSLVKNVEVVKARSAMEEKGTPSQGFENNSIWGLRALREKQQLILASLLPSVFYVTLKPEELARQRAVLDVVSVWSNMESSVAAEVLQKELVDVEAEHNRNLEAEGAKLLGMGSVGGGAPRDPREKR
ncbi:hypothetical protein TrLO_g11889 [Triparma laevis f. longispina]|uniref:Uncharacterized protein n=1 Tax=Triparma laevis f. longispina TaxID=1714387 RepID=A0A9W7L178_9STRA|nr:hypothetical protein TrLO_g11889 [Triparma laevis f. longispina]